MMDIVESIINSYEVKKGDIFYMEKHDYITGESGKSRPHLIIDVVDGYCGGALVVPMSSQYKLGSIPIITNINKNIVSYVLPCNMVLIPLCDIKKYVKSSEYVSTVDPYLCDGLKMIYMIKILKYVPVIRDKEVLDYMTEYITACNNCHDKYTNVYGKHMPIIDINTMEEKKVPVDSLELKRKEADMLTESVLKARIYKDCDDNIKEYVLKNVELYLGGNMFLKDLSKMLSLASSSISEKHKAIKKELGLI